MPYILEIRRKKLKPLIDKITWTEDLNVGDLTYIFYQIALNYVKQKGVSYSVLSQVITALECAKMEFYRRKVSPYEDMKIQRNGDIK